MVTDSDNSKNNNFKNENVMEAPFLKRLKWTLIAAWLLYVLSLNKANAADYYWVGGTGNWSDVSHWATTSGGTTFHTLPPGVGDDVYFDINASLTNGDSVYFNLAINSCLNFTCSAGLDSVIFFGDLNIYGDLSLYSQVFWGGSNLKGTNNKLRTANSVFSFVSLEIGSNYSLIGDLNTTLTGGVGSGGKFVSNSYSINTSFVNFLTVYAILVNQQLILKQLPITHMRCLATVAIWIVR
ncbi:MAG: hypothetical protein IPJ79_12030 [Bacteroidetes bacterium]|nr:hypothetical protein [Bacteroidota bacterium]